MTIHVTVLARGGCSAYGGAWWDHRDGVVRLHVLPEDAVVDVVIQAPETVSELDYEENGIDGSAPTIEGDDDKEIHLQFQTIAPCGRYRIDAQFASGAKRTVIFQAHEAQTYVHTEALDPTDDDDDDPGDWG